MNVHHPSSPHTTLPAGEVLLKLLASRGVAFFFVNSGTDFPSIVEALAQVRADAKSVPRTLLVPHENVAVGMAYGVTMVTGRAQAVMVHVNVGTANALCGLINASRENIPMLLAAGRTPWFEKGSVASRSLNIHWAQEMFDQAGIVREHCKWDYELRAAQQLESVIDRAMAISHAQPQGPVYLSLPREAMHQSCAAPVANAQAPVMAGQPDPGTMAEMARVLAVAERPLIITSRAGRDPRAVEVLGRIALRHAWPVVEFRPRYLNLPNTHPMHGGYEVQPWLTEADAILVLDSDVPWIPGQAEPREGVPVLHVGADPLFSRYPVRSFRSDLSVSVEPLACLHALEQALASHGPPPPSREAWVAGKASARSRALTQAIEAGRRPDSPLTMAAASYALGLALAQHPDAIVINEYSLVPAALRLETPGSYFGSSPVGGLGWGLPAALGARLARPDALVIAALGDGSYSFANPLACHHSAAMHDIPVLTLVLNNSGYGAVERATRAMYPEGQAVREGMALSDLRPMPRFDQVVEACGGWGARVQTWNALQDALSEAIEQVRVHRRQALIDVICA